MKVLIACEFSDIVRSAFERRGHDAVSCDLLPTEGNPARHYQGDVRNILNGGWDMLIAHPPCTYICNSGVRWLHTEKGRWEKMTEASLFFRTLLDSDIPLVMTENPIPHRYAVALIGRKYDQIIQPHDFGHGETKATCLWLKGLPHLVPTNKVSGRKARVHRTPPSPDRWKKRSRTLAGIAEAMASQWG